MIINWYGEGCFKIQTGGFALLTDPLESSSGLMPARGKTDLILKTLTPWPMDESAPIKTSANEGGELIRGAGEYEVQKIEVAGYELIKESGENFFKTVYKVLAEGMTLGFLGHLSGELTSEANEDLKNADILFIPAGGKPFINQESAAKLIKQLSPKIVIASFFKVPGLKRQSSDWKNLSEEMGQKPEIIEHLTIKEKETRGQKGTKLTILKI